MQESISSNQKSGVVSDTGHDGVLLDGRAEEEVDSSPNQIVVSTLDQNLEAQIVMETKAVGHIAGGEYCPVLDVDESGQKAGVSDTDPGLGLDFLTGRVTQKQKERQE